MTLPLVYVAHPLSAPTRDAMRDNRLNGARWCGWLAINCGVAPLAPWIPLSTVWTEEEGRELGLECDKATIAACKALILTGGRISSGMQVEIDFATSVGVSIADCTGVGFAPPSYAYRIDAQQRYRSAVHEAVNLALGRAA